MWMIAALLAAAPVAAEAPLAASSKWRVDYGDSACTASRLFADARGKVEILIERVPFATDTTVYLVVNAKMAPALIKGDVSLAGESGGPVAAHGAVLLNLRRGRRAVRLYLPPDFAKTLARTGVLQVMGGGLHVPALRIEGAEAVTSAMDACERTFAKDLGIDPSATARIAMPPTVIELADAFWNEGYPYEAIQSAMEGDSYILWRIDAKGKAQDCRLIKSSGHELLDRTACQIVVARGRFVPAYDATGVALDGYMSTAVRWRMARQ